MRTKWTQMSAREAMISLAGVPGHGEQPRWLKKVSDVANISTRTARSLWRGEITDENHRAIRAINRAVEAKAIEEANALANQYKKIIAGMELADPEFHGPHITALLDALRAMGRLDRA